MPILLGNNQQVKNQSDIFSMLEFLYNGYFFRHEPNLSLKLAFLFTNLQYQLHLVLHSEQFFMILYMSLECSIASALILPTMTVVKVLSLSRPTCTAQTSCKHCMSATPMVQFHMATNWRFSQPLCILKRANFTLRCYIQLQLHFMLYYKGHICKSSLRIQHIGTSVYKNCGCTTLTAPRCIPNPEASLTLQLRHFNGGSIHN